MEPSINDIKTAPTIRIDPQPIRVGKFTIPPLCIRTACLLERIESPFVVPTYDHETGKPAARMPSIMDVTRALYVFVHAEDADIEDLADDRKRFDKAVLEMAREIRFADLSTIAKAIGRTVNVVNEAAESAGMEPSGNARPTGGQPS